MERIRIFVLSSNQELRTQIRSAFSGQKDLHLEREEVRSSDLISAARQGSPDVVIIDADGSIDASLQVAFSVKGGPSDTKVMLLISVKPSAEYVQKGRVAGAAGFFQKDCIETDLVNVVRDVCRPGRYEVHG